MIEYAAGVIAGETVLCLVTALVHLRLARTAPRSGGLTWPGAWLLLALAAGSGLAAGWLPYGLAIRFGGGLLVAGLAMMAITVEQGGTEKVFDLRALTWAVAALVAFLALGALVSPTTWRIAVGVSWLLTLGWLAWSVWERVAAPDLRALFALGMVVLAVPASMLLWTAVAPAFQPRMTSSLLLIGTGLLAAASILLVVNIESSGLRAAIADLEETHEHLVRMTEADPLTGLPTRQALRAWFDRWQGGEPVSVVLIDVDGLKRVNLRHGQGAGDEALRLVAEVVAQSTRPGDLVVRWGGDELVALLQGAGRDAALRRFAGLAGRLEEAAKGLPYASELEVSWGAASCASAAEISSALTAADESMYAMKRSKSSGRGDRDG
ncbi:MAG: GGDEF domain-containing protein [Acidobacteriota bacterium]